MVLSILQLRMIVIFRHVFEWSTGADTEDIMGLAPDTYTITVSNAAGCRDSISHTFVIPNALTAMETVSAPSCGGWQTVVLPLMHLEEECLTNMILEMVMGLSIHPL